MKYLLVALIVLASYAHASDCIMSDSRCKKASQLVAVLGYEDTIKAFQDSCFEQSKAFSPDVLIKKDPSLFYGITAESRKWPKVTEAYEHYKREYCVDSVRPLLLDAYRDAWAKNLTDEELASALAYLRSPSGRGFAHALPNIYRSVTRQALPTLNEIGQQAYLHYAKRLRVIADE